MTDAVLQRLADRLPPDAGLQIPPPVFTDMEAEVVGYAEGEALRVRFPVLARYQNPMGLMQGGVLVAAIDNCVGPLSFLVAPPSVTTHLNTQYLRPVPPSCAWVEVEARLVARTRTLLHFDATVTDDGGRAVARAQATCQVLAPEQLAR